MKVDEFPRVFDISTTAAAVGVKPRVLRHWVDKKEVIPLRIAGRLYFTPELIRRMIDNKLGEIETKEMQELDEEII
ncbi:MAG: MerR family transcriptional regulator [Candidatus Dadabacteria bacterium]|nr:MerR family transcriptional regulator [Candidatus Dadabacteria bacterium]